MGKAKKADRPAIGKQDVTALMRHIDQERAELSERLEHLSVVWHYLAELAEGSVPKRAVPTVELPASRQSANSKPNSGPEAVRHVFLHSARRWLTVPSICTGLQSVGFKYGGKQRNFKPYVRILLNRRSDLFKKHPNRRGLYKLKDSKERG